MLSRNGKPRRFVPAALSMLIFSGLNPAYGDPGRQPQDGGLGFVSPRVDRLLAHSIEIALKKATAKLTAPKCLSIFSDFTDAGGRPLAENLKATGQGAAQYLTGMLFYDGSATSECRRSEVLAVTSPGSRAVYVCGQRFTQTARLQPAVAANLLIHEALHSLGLGENPPSSQEINRRVIAKCGA